MTEDDVLFGFRLRLFTLAEELGNVSEACRAMGVARSTYYAWKPKLERYGLDGLRVRERRKPRMPNQIGPHLEHRILAFALGHPGFVPRRISAELARPKWGGIRVSENGVWCVLRRFNLNTRCKRLALIARHADPYERKPEIPPRELSVITDKGDAIEFSSYTGKGELLCTARFLPQEGLEGVELANVGEDAERAVQIDAELTGVEYEATGGAYCAEPEIRTTGVLSGQATLAGVE